MAIGELESYVLATLVTLCSGSSILIQLYTNEDPDSRLILQILGTVICILASSLVGCVGGILLRDPSDVVEETRSNIPRAKGGNPSSFIIQEVENTKASIKRLNIDLIAARKRQDAAGKDIKRIARDTKDFENNTNGELDELQKSLDALKEAFVKGSASVKTLQKELQGVRTDLEEVRADLYTAREQLQEVGMINENGQFLMSLKQLLALQTPKANENSTDNESSTDLMIYTPNTDDSQSIADMSPKPSKEERIEYLQGVINDLQSTVQEDRRAINAAAAEKHDKEQLYRKMIYGDDQKAYNDLKAARQTYTNLCSLVDEKKELLEGLYRRISLLDKEGTEGC